MDTCLRRTGDAVTRREFLGTAPVAAVAATSISRDLFAADAAASVSPFGEARRFAGSPEERGRAYGEAFREAIRGFLTAEIERAFVGKPYLRDELIRYAAACGKIVEKECPEIAAELGGMCAGSGLSHEETLLITLHEELYHRGVIPPVPHCTAVAVSKPETAAGTTYCGQTWDWMPSVAGLSTMLRWERTAGPSLLAYGFPGLWCGAGLNANGLALCWTSANLGYPNQSPRIGIPSYVMLTHLLYQENLDAVRDAALRHRHAGWFTFVMADGTGRLMNIEGSPEGIEVTEQPGRMIRIGFGTHRMTHTPKDAVVKLHPRCQKAESALDAAKGHISLDTMKTTFSDPSLGVCVGRGTIDLMIYDTTNRVAHLSRGADYGLAWQTYRFGP
jgi:hypothetical protein